MKVIRILFAAIIILLVLLTGCSQKKQIDVAAYNQGMQQWQAKRAEGLQKENGWLTLCGLFWLKEGENKFGTDSANAVIFPPDRSPKYAGSIFLEKGELRLKTAKDAGVKANDSLVTEMKIQSDRNGDSNPTMMTLGSLTFYVIERGEKLGIRLKDNQNPSRIHFKGLEYFPVDVKWRLEAKFEPYNPPKIVPITNVLNQVSNDTCNGAIAFDVDGKTYRLDALTEGKEFFIIFHDETAGKETYGMGRFLGADMPDSTNTVILDFNKAYNPPCAFTTFATCPMPPKQNYLPIRIEAGEKRYAGSSH
jgi:uncharacterized protein